MWTWPALLLSPLLALGAQSMAYALATPSCAQQREAALHASLAGCLLLSLVFTAMALIEMRRRSAAAPGDAAAARAGFVARVAAGTGAVASLVIAAMWAAPLVLSPCLS